MTQSKTLLPAGFSCVGIIYKIAKARCFPA